MRCLWPLGILIRETKLAEKGGTHGKAKYEPCKGVPLIFDFRKCVLSQPVPKARVGVGSRATYFSNGDI